MTPEAQRRAITSVTGVYRNYTGDLNAMHEAEKVLDDDQCELYFDILNNPKGKLEYYPANEYVIHATAAQRAEAFLKTLGLWT